MAKVWAGAVGGGRAALQESARCGNPALSLVRGKGNDDYQALNLSFLG